MDYPILNKAPDVAAAVVPHQLDGNGNAVPVTTGRAAATPTVTASSAYASGNADGGLLTFAGLPGAGVLQTVLLRDKAGQGVSYDLFLFDSAPAAPTDKAALALSAADLAKCIGVVPRSGAALAAASTMAVLAAAGLGLAYRLNGT